MSLRDWINIDFFFNLNLLFKLQNAIPDFEVSSVPDIRNILNERNIEAVILDIDQTLVPFGESQISDEVRDFTRWLVARVNLCLLSNVPRTNARMKRIREIETQLGIKAIFPDKRKPSPLAFQAALEYLRSHPSKTLMVGDRIFTDIMGANHLGILTVLVPPIYPKTDPFLMVKLPRWLEPPYLKFAKWRKNQEKILD
ncbi:MAG: YqeG family HAD IIIA-type phosphatase [Candidatus Aminicenantes bacterium]|nr:YqeG family HAD IIIA-type phosphatase [Candidatus Aminicenantes bacterium]